MKTRKIRLLSALLALAMLLALLPTAAFAADIVDSGTCGAEGNGSNVTWSLDSDGTLTIAGSGKMKDYQFTDAPWKSQSDQIKKIVIKNGVTSIGINAFYLCSNATTVDIPESVTSISYGAFQSSGLTSVAIPASVTELVWNAFFGCNKLQKVEFASDAQLKKIGMQAFQGCTELKEITIPASVTTIENRAFSWCSSLKKVIFEKGSKLNQIGNIDLVFNQCPDVKIYYSDESVKQVLMDAGMNLDKIKPANPTVKFDSNGGTTVDAKTVVNGEKVSPPADPTREGWNFVGWYTKDASGNWADEAFNFDTPITDDVTLYARWTAGGNCGAEGNGSNVTWTLDSDGTLTISGTGAMADYTDPYAVPWYRPGVSIKQIVIGDEVTSIGDFAFYGVTEVTNVTIPESVTSIGKYAFTFSGIMSIAISTNITTIDRAAFAACTKLISVDLSNATSLKEIGIYAFADCPGLTEVKLPQNGVLETIGDYAFSVDIENEEGKKYALKITEITIPTSVKTIGQGAFWRCSELEKVCFATGSHLKTVGESAFDECHTNLKIICDESVKQVLVKAGMDEGKIETYPPAPTPDPKPETYPITIDYGTAYNADGEPIEKAAEGEVVTIEADETAFDGMVFEYWKDHNGNAAVANDHAAKTNFTMPAGEVHLEAMPKVQNDDSSWDAATVVTGVAIGTGTAILAYHIGTELYAEQVLGKGVPVPRTRAEVALLAWQLAGKPAVAVEGEPLSEAAQAQRWAVESGLMQNDAEGGFNGAKKMSKLKALRTLEKAQKLA